MNRVEVVPHDPAWKDAFAVEAKCIAEALGENVVAIDHIGSTAISGIHAKPIIDILVEVKNIDATDSRSAEMESLGYQVMGEFGIEGRRYFRKDNADGIRTHHVHAFEIGSPHISRHRAFRDHMIRHPEDAQAYSDLKRTLAEKHGDNADQYMDGKDEFIKDIDRRAGS